jgi:CubicO group peptidase (beta-lactamase class C family)
VHGICDERFTKVKEILEANLDSGADLGASVAVFLDGEPVVDLWGGIADETTGRAWEEDTIVNVWSTTKTMTNLCALMLADRGEIDLHAPVARYWPEFAAGGKGAVEVRHLLAHTAGLPGWDTPLVPTDLADWDKCTSALAAQEPWWEPGTASGYHAVTQGYLVGEVVRRVTGCSLGEFFAREVAGPLDADFHIGLAAEHDGRVARLVPPPPGVPEGFEVSELVVRAMVNPLIGAPTTDEEWWRRCESPAANGHGNARSVAAVHSVVACGGEARGVPLLSSPGVEVIFDLQADNKDLILSSPLRFGMGFGLQGELMDIGPHAYYWGGYGGSVVVADLDLRLCVAYMMNRMEGGLVGDTRGNDIVRAATEAAACR